MKLTLERFKFSDKSTIGKLSFNGIFYCFTLEDVDRKLESGGKKIQNETAIPRGTYSVVIDYSPRFNRDLPRLLNVPQFEGVRIHPGNDKDDTEGCILVGSSYSDDWINNSRATFNSLFDQLEAFYDKGIDISIEIT